MTNELGFDTKFAAQIGESQVWEGKEILFDPDSSPAAWEHYLRFYKPEKWLKDYEFNKQSLKFFKLDEELKDKKKIYRYREEVDKKDNRLYVLNKEINKMADEYGGYENGLRLGGDTDFNFNKNKYDSFSTILSNDLKNDKEEFEKQKAELDKCSKMHHTLLNFSLMQTMGKMQQVKEEGLKLPKGSYEHFDRLDTLIYFLDCFYNETDKEKVLRKANNRKNPNNPDEPTHRECLEGYLSLFSGIYDYCKKIYFIDKALTEKLIENGKKPIKTAEDVKRYMALAIEFWKQKEKYLKNLLANP